MAKAKAKWKSKVPPKPSCLRREASSALIRPVHVPVDGGGVPAYDAAQPGGRGRRARRPMCAVASGSPGRPASECGILRHGDGTPDGAPAPPEGGNVRYPSSGRRSCD